MCLFASLQDLVPRVLGFRDWWSCNILFRNTKGDFPSSPHRLTSYLVASPPHPPLETQFVSTQWAATSHFVPFWRRWALKQRRNCLISLGPFLPPVSHDFFSGPTQGIADLNLAPGGLLKAAQKSSLKNWVSTWSFLVKMEILGVAISNTVLPSNSGGERGC